MSAMNRSKLLAALLVLTVAACGTVGVQGDRCEIGRAQSCPCASGAVGVQECSPAGVYGACVCAADAGADVAVAVDTAPADGAPDAPELLLAPVHPPHVVGRVPSLREV